MKCYVIAQLDITDWDSFRKYQAAFVALFPDYDGRVLAVDQDVTVVEGEWPHSFVAVIEFRDRSEAARWYHSADYQAAIRAHRWPASHGNMIFVAGLPDG